MSMMVQNLISKEEIGRLQQVFKKLDVNQDGKLQYEELLNGYAEHYDILEHDLVKEEVDRIFRLVDTDQSGEIDFSEFVTATVNRQDLLQEEKLRAAFSVYDKDGGGTISIDEIKAVLGMGKDISEEVWNQIVKEVDENGDGEVDFEEFSIMMRQLLIDAPPVKF
jgi:calcium-dependent protein kinase